jgi:CheY-like chemotaxis protein
VTRELLTSLGFSVSHVASADAALRILTPPHDIEIVLSDLVMPGNLNGWELARHLRSRQPALRILLTTGSVPPPAGLEHEFPLLLKPYSADSLAQALEGTFATGLEQMAVALR